MGELLGYAAIWYTVGLPLAVILYGYKNGIIRIGDLGTILLLGGLGPAWLLVILFDILTSWLKTNQNVILWRSRAKKTEHILYGDDKEEDSRNSDNNWSM